MGDLAQIIDTVFINPVMYRRQQTPAFARKIISHLKNHRCYSYILNSTIYSEIEIVWYFIGVYKRSLEKCFQHSGRNFVSPRGHVISSIYANHYHDLLSLHFLGYGYLLHSSGKCVHWRSPRMVLKHECGGITGIVSLQEDGTLSFTNNVMAYSRFQFTDGNSLQDIINNNMCMVPTDNESLEPELAVRENQCGRPESTFVFQSKYKGCGDRIFPCEGMRCYFLMLKSHFFPNQENEIYGSFGAKRRTREKTKLRKMNC